MNSFTNKAISAPGTESAFGLPVTRDLIGSLAKVLNKLGILGEDVDYRPIRAL